MICAGWGSGGASEGLSNRVSSVSRQASEEGFNTECCSVHLEIGDLRSAARIVSSPDSQSRPRIRKIPSGARIRSVGHSVAALSLSSTSLNVVHCLSLKRSRHDCSASRVDYAHVKPSNGDGFVNWLTTHLVNALGAGAVMRTRARIVRHRGVEVCRLDVARSTRPVWAKTSKATDVFFVRMNNSSRSMADGERDEYIAQHWGS